MLMEENVNIRDRESVCQILGIFRGYLQFSSIVTAYADVCDCESACGCLRSNTVRKDHFLECATPLVAALCLGMILWSFIWQFLWRNFMCIPQVWGSADPISVLSAFFFKLISGDKTRRFIVSEHPARMHGVYVHQHFFAVCTNISVSFSSQSVPQQHMMCVFVHASKCLQRFPPNKSCMSTLQVCPPIFSVNCLALCLQRVIWLNDPCWADYRVKSSQAIYLMVDPCSV